MSKNHHPFANNVLNAIKIKGQIHYVLYFNLDVIISVGYRVKSKRGVMFEPNLFRSLFKLYIDF